MAEGLLDSHFHLTSPRFEGEREAVLRRAREAGVVAGVVIASDVADARVALEWTCGREEETEAAPALRASVGIHPHEAAGAEPGVLEDLRHLARQPAVVAIGETGLDFHYENSPRDVQLELFRAHVRLAAETGLPLVVHSRDAVEETADVLRDLPAGTSGVLHCFTGGMALLDAALDAGWYVSFSGIATFSSFDAEEELRAVPADRLLVETDAPYLAPAPVRGMRNEPAFVRHVVEGVAALRGEDPEESARRTRENALRLFSRWET